MIGELVISQAMVTQEAGQYHDHSLSKNLEYMRKITRDLQEISMTLRMVPLKSTFLKMSRIVRDVAKKKGKSIDLCVSGEDTELDKTVVDKIGDPLVHMIRNSVDHGIEDDISIRRKHGKSDRGRIELRAFHRGGSIYIEIEDDGKGLDTDAILKKAIQRGLVKEGENISESEIHNFIFEPGFSTAKVITDVSGRGVGMDVVRRNIDSLRGQIDINSIPGEGTTFSIRLPLTLAIIDGMVVRCGKEKYIFPTLSVVTSVRPEAKHISTVKGSNEMYTFQNTLIPILRISKLFEIEESNKDITNSILIIVEDQGKRVAFMTDELLGQQEIVIKSLGTYLKNLNGISGGAILPDGMVGLILDVGGLVKINVI
ncbi:MAG: hypothetical protein ACD_79C01010G0002 [uncultured bacterium]|nr:MAG: hypothetical protein ACD_79C01010G0002 [uncultured bacterium]